METTPETLLEFQCLAAKLMHRACELNIKTPHDIRFNIYKLDSDLALGLYWYMNGDRSQLPIHPEQTDDLLPFLYTSESLENIKTWFFNANVAFDLLEADSKAA